jgi:hypothetical protein
MKIELITTGKKNDSVGEIYHLFINGKSDGFKYEQNGMGEVSPWSRKKKHMEWLMQINCKEFPEELNLWHTTAYPVLPGRLSVFGMQKKGNKMLFEVGFDFGTESYNRDTWPLNPYLLRKKIYKYSRRSIFKKYDEDDYDTTINSTFNFQSDLKGTIGDKFKIAFETLTRIVNKAEGELRSEAKSYLK